MEAIQANLRVDNGNSYYIGRQKSPASPQRQPEPVHLRHDKQTSKAEAEHLPEVGSVTERNQCSVNEDEDFLRRDARWTFGASATKLVQRRLSIEVGYRFEARDSNDPDKIYSAHLATVVLGYRLLAGR